MFERLHNVYNAVIGRKATCGGNCTCHSVGSKLGDTGASVNEDMGGFVDYDLSKLSPELQTAIEGMLTPGGLEQLQAELDRQNECECTEESNDCVHLDYIPVCHCKEGDAKPEWCSASKCPVRMFQVALDEMNKKASMIAYG